MYTGAAAYENKIFDSYIRKSCLINDYIPRCTGGNHIMFKILYIIAIIAVSAVTIFIFTRILKKSTVSSAIISFLLVICSLFSITIVQSVPPLTEPVKITALSQKSQDSEGYDVRFTDFNVEGKKYEFDEPSEGKWFYHGDSYMWRPDWDKRQPEGTTRSITVQVPIGAYREINFVKSQWGGKAHVSVYGQITEVDTFEQGTVSIPDSRKKFMAYKLIYQTAVFTVALWLMGLLILLFVKVFAADRNGDKVKKRLIYAGIAGLSLAVMITYSQNHTLWLDEIFQIGFSGTGKSLYETLMVPETTPPLFRLAANIWYNLVPYGEEWLLLLPELACAGAVYLLGLIGEEWKNRRTGILAASFLGLASTVYISAAYEFRAYGFLLFFSAALVLSHIKRIKKGNNATMRDILCMGLWMVPLAYTHYFGVFLCCVLFLYDFILFCSGKIRWKCIFSYILVFVLYIPWLFRFFQLGQIELEASWQTDPTGVAAFNLIKYLCGNAEFAIFLLAVGFLAILASNFRAGIKRKSSWEALPPYPLFSLIVFTVALYFYGRVVNVNATLWTNRYFIVLFPFSALVIARGADAIVSFAGRLAETLKKDSYAVCSGVACALIVVGFFVTNFPAVSNQPNVKNHNQNFDIAADWIYSQTTEIFSDKTLVISADQSFVGDGWYEYYVTQKGRRDELNYVNQDELYAMGEASMIEFLKKYDTIYVCYAARTKSSALTDMLSEYFVETEDAAGAQVVTFRSADVQAG